jgi:hypothetical protein
MHKREEASANLKVTDLPLEKRNPQEQILPQLSSSSTQSWRSAALHMVLLESQPPSWGIIHASAYTISTHPLLPYQPAQPNHHADVKRRSQEAPRK